MTGRLYAVILAGGEGTRLWPLSRSRRPKFLLKVKRQSLLRQTIDRLRGVVPLSRIRIVCGRRQLKGIREEWPGVPRNVLMGEPVGRNTAAAIGWAAHEIARQDPDAVIVFMPADHLVGRPAEFRSVLRKGVSFLKKRDLLLTVGIRPDRPETGYGYIEIGSKEGNGLFRVRRFFEKPSLARARRFWKGRRHLWNAGLFLGRARTFLEEIERFMPPLAKGLADLKRGKGIGAVYARLPSVSIDYGVMEKSRRVAVIPADFGWKDVGDLGELLRLQGERKGRLLSVDSERVLVSGGRRLVATLGVNDLIVVETDDALLIADRRNPQRVREVVKALRGRGLHEFL